MFLVDTYSSRGSPRQKVSRPNLIANLADYVLMRSTHKLSQTLVAAYFPNRYCQLTYFLSSNLLLSLSLFFSLSLSLSLSLSVFFFYRLFLCACVNCLTVSLNPWIDVSVSLAPVLWGWQLLFWWAVWTDATDSESNRCWLSLHAMSKTLCIIESEGVFFFFCMFGCIFVWGYAFG